MILKIKIVDLETDNRLENKAEAQNEKDVEEKMTLEEAEREVDERIVPMIKAMGSGVSDETRLFYIRSNMDGTYEEDKVMSGLRLEMSNKRIVENLASKYRGKIITPSLIYRDNTSLLYELIQSNAASSSASGMRIMAEREILENIFKSAGVSFKWEDIDLRKFEEMKVRHEDLEKSAEKLKSSLKQKKPGEVTLQDISDTDKKVLEILLSHLGKDSNQWKEFFEEYLPSHKDSFVLKMDESVGVNKAKEALGKVLADKSKSYSKITPYGIYNASPNLYKALYALLGNDKSKWQEFFKSYVGEDAYKKLDFSPVNLREVEKKKAEDRVLKNQAGRLKTLISLVESKEGSGGKITPESIYKYGKKYGINVYGAIYSVIGSSSYKWTRMFRNFLPGYKGKFSYKSVNKGAVDVELRKADTLKRLGSSLKSLIDSKGSGKITTESIYKYAPGLFQKLQNTLGNSGEAWKGFFRDSLGSSYASRFEYISFSRNQVNKEKKISALNNVAGAKFLSLMSSINSPTISPADIKSKNPALYFQLFSVLGTDSNLWNLFLDKSVGSSNKSKFKLSFKLEKREGMSEGINKFSHLGREIERMQIQMKNIKIPTVVTPQFFYDNFPEEYRKINFEIKDQKKQWEVFVAQFFPELDNRFLWRPVDIKDDKDEKENLDEKKKKEEIEIKEEDRPMFEMNASVLTMELKKALVKEEGKISIKKFQEDHPTLINNIKDIIGNKDEVLTQYIKEALGDNGLSKAEIDRIEYDVRKENIEDTVDNDIFKILEHRLYTVLVDLFREKENPTFSDLHDRDTNLFSDLEEYFEKNHTTLSQFIDQNYPQFKGRLQEENIALDENEDTKQSLSSSDVFGEEQGKEYTEEQTKTKEAVSELLDLGLEKEGDGQNELEEIKEVVLEDDDDQETEELEKENIDTEVNNEESIIDKKLIEEDDEETGVEEELKTEDKRLDFDEEEKSEKEVMENVELEITDQENEEIIENNNEDIEKLDREDKNQDQDELNLEAEEHKGQQEEQFSDKEKEEDLETEKDIVSEETGLYTEKNNEEQTEGGADKEDEGDKQGNSIEKDLENNEEKKEESVEDGGNEEKEIMEDSKNEEQKQEDEIEDLLEDIKDSEELNIEGEEDTNDSENEEKTRDREFENEGDDSAGDKDQDELRLEDKEILDKEEEQVKDKELEKGEDVDEEPEKIEELDDETNIDQEENLNIETENTDEDIDENTEKENEEEKKQKEIQKEGQDYENIELNNMEQLEEEETIESIKTTLSMEDELNLDKVEKFENEIMEDMEEEKAQTENEEEKQLDNKDEENIVLSEEDFGEKNKEKTSKDINDFSLMDENISENEDQMNDDRVDVDNKEKVKMDEQTKAEDQIEKGQKEETEEFLDIPENGNLFIETSKFDEIVEEKSSKESDKKEDRWSIEDEKLGENTKKDITETTEYNEINETKEEEKEQQVETHVSNKAESIEKDSEEEYKERESQVDVEKEKVEWVELNMETEPTNEESDDMTPEDILNRDDNIEKRELNFDNKNDEETKVDENTNEKTKKELGDEELLQGQADIEQRQEEEKQNIQKLNEEKEKTDSEKINEIKNAVQNTVKDLKQSEQARLMRDIPRLYASIQQNFNNDEKRIKKFIVEYVKSVKYKYYDEETELRQQEKNRMKIIEKEEEIKDNEKTESSVEEKDKDKETAQTKEQQSIKQKNLEDILNNCIQKIPKQNKSSNISFNIVFPPQISEKEVKNEVSIYEQFTFCIEKLLHINGVISTIKVRSSNYSEYLTNAYCDVKISMTYSMSEDVEELHLWQFSINKVGMKINN